MSVALVAGAGVLLYWLERRRELRPRVEGDLEHTSRNLAIAAAGAMALQLAERPIVDRLARVVVRRRWGLVQRLRLAREARATIALLLLDYTLYLWHVLVHRYPRLWRAHAVHHIDRDLDASTAIRFHFIELVASVPWRAAQIVVIGVSPHTLSVWQTSVLLSILFHHSNVRLPAAAERVLGWLIVTPRMHGIHHSDREDERESNWSSGLTIWDRLHGTLRLDVAQSDIRIGVQGFAEDDDVSVGKMLALPLTYAVLR
jgi:sterol desaturase/sphingolipid hydroxylase (fatty acid hydroxylase superfamily)